MLYLHFCIYFDCKDTTKIGNKEELCKKNRRATKKVPKYLELIENVLIFAPSERKFWLSG
jgi:hypothetical protein